MKNHSKITIREDNKTRKVAITSDGKPGIEESILQKWQTLVDTAAKLVGVPSGLIMRLNRDNIEVFVRSNTEGNPYEEGEKAELIYGLYCETVIGTQQKLTVPDATKSDIWSKDNPDVDLGMISYLGFPVNWPDGEVFGTICVLDDKENSYNQEFEDLLWQVKQHLESDLKILLLNEELKEKNLQLEQANATKSKFLTLISHDIRGNISTISEFLKFLKDDLDNYDKNKLKQLLTALSQSASSTYETLEDLLSWSKNETLQLEPEIKVLDIVAIIDQLLVYFSKLIELKEIQVTKSYDSEQVWVEADQKMIMVILRNIISNAVKYNRKQGELIIRIATSGDLCEVSIQDTGIGMSQSTVDKLFTYNESYGDGTNRKRSAGIGLILVKEFLDKLEADITVESEPDVGSTFKIEITRVKNGEE